jgi:hypothetical protein
MWEIKFGENKGEDSVSTCKAASGWSRSRRQKARDRVTRRSLSEADNFFRKINKLTNLEKFILFKKTPDFRFYHLREESLTHTASESAKTEKKSASK